MSYVMAMHFQMALKEPKQYIEKMASAKEMRHPLLGQEARDTFLVNTAPLIFELKNKEAIESTCKQLIELSHRYQNRDSKDFLKPCQ